MLALKKYQNCLKQFIHTANQKEARLLYISNPNKDFTRCRKIAFKNLASFILQLPKKSSAVAIHQFSQLLDRPAFSKAALYQARWKIRRFFFEHLFYQTVKWHFQFLCKNTWKGFQLLAVDGTAFRVPDSKENRIQFGQHHNQHDGIASARLVAWFDILNDIVVAIHFHKRSTAEVKIAYQQIKHLPADTLSIYDRGYASTGLIWLHQFYGSHCLIRIKPQLSLQTKRFIDAGFYDQIVTLKLGERAFYTLQHQLNLGNRIKKFQAFKARLIRIDLPNGTTELLMTTLLDQHRYKTAQFNWLYQKRWTVETCFDRIKNKLMLGTFSAYRAHFVWQDIWATFIYHNILSAYVHLAQKIRDLKAKTGNLYEYHINRNVAAGILNYHLPKLVVVPKSRGDPTYIILDQMAHFVEAFKPKRSCPRKRKMMRINDRHQTEKNYKRAF